MAFSLAATIASALWLGARAGFVTLASAFAFYWIAVSSGPVTSFERELLKHPSYPWFVAPAGALIVLIAAYARSQREKFAKVHARLSDKSRLLDMSSDAIFAWDADHRVTYWNRGAETLYGYSRDEAMGQVVQDVLKTEFPKPIEQIYSALEDNGGWSGELVHTCKNGWRRVVLSRWTVDRDDDGHVRVVLESNTDITERKRVEQALRDSEDRYKQIVESQVEMVCRFRPDGTLLFVNGAYARMRGCDRTDIEGTNFWAFVPEVDHAKLRAMLESLSPASPEAVVENRVETQQGTRWMLWRNRALAFDDQGRCTEAQSSGIDITERKDAEERARMLAHQALAANAKFEAVFSQSGIFVGITDLDGKLREVNDLAVVACGFRREDVLCIPFWEAGWWKGSPAVQERIRAAVAKAAGGEVFREVLPYWHADMTERVVDFAMHPIRDNTGKVIFLHPTGIDITERTRAESELRIAKEKAEAAGRAKDDFIAALSHELRTPLTPALMIATELAEDASASPELREQLRMVRDSIELETRLIDDLLDLTRIARGSLLVHPTITSIHALLTHTRKVVAHDIADSGLKVDFQLEAEQHHVNGDPARLQQVFWNLLRNAIKFTPAGGEVTVRTRNIDHRLIEIAVQDTGIGISASALERIFKPFEQGDLGGSHKFGGLGLGLSIAKAIVELHRGRVRAVSEGPSRGACFIVELETVRCPEKIPSNTNDPQESMRGLRLLVVEDHKPTRLILTRMLTHDGHNVFAAGSLQEARALVATQEFDVFISDLGLPDGNGLDLMEEIKATRGWPGIALTGYGQREDLERSRNAGFSTHIVKPIEPKQLRQALHDTVTGRTRSTPRSSQQP
ncbi:MAG: PAS domain S-box protein [Nibricoccus sp.]